MQIETGKSIRNRFLTAGLLFALVLVTGVSATIAWLVAPGEAYTDGMEMEGISVNYDITPVANGSNGIYHNYYTAIETEPDVLVWQMTEDSNMDNYGGGDAGIEPGSSGKISFVVTPKVDSVELLFDLEIAGYVSGHEMVNGQPKVTMDEITKESRKNYLNGHILLFEKYENDKYSGLIASDEDMKRVFRKNFAGKDTPVTVDLYWVWPEHLSNLVDAYNGTTVTEQSFIAEGDDYQAVISHMQSFPLYYFKGEAEDAAIVALASNTENKIINSYDLYGGLYDEADNDIGTGVEFILVRMTVSEWE